MHLLARVLCLFALLLSFSFKMADRLLEGQEGDYLITEQDNIYSILLIRSLQKNAILLEEVSIPSHLINLSSIHWKSWIKQGAPGHSSWIQYEIDPQTLKLLEGYSFSKKGWLYLEDSERFLSNLLSLSLANIPPTDRKKIGPLPRDGEEDRRPLWTPSFHIEGVKQSKSPCEVWKGLWPKDDSLLSSCQITFYFPLQQNIPFPIWIEASNGHLQYRIRCVDCGNGMTSPRSKMIPRRPPQIVKSIQKNKDQIVLPVKAPSYYKTFSLFVFDLTNPQKHLGPIPHQMKAGQEKETLFLSIDLQALTPLLLDQHLYKWVLLPHLSEESPGLFQIESEDFFLWPSLASR